MPRVNVYLPDDLADEVRQADLNVSAIAQAAIREALAERSLARWLAELDASGDDGDEVDRDALLAALDEARDELGA